MLEKNQKCLIVILGPTASGKTDLSIQIAKKIKSHIISADSRQFFKELDIGTAKPTNIQMKKVKHYCINNLSIKQSYNAGMFEVDVMKLLKKLFVNTEFVIMVGGSGLYIDAVCKGLDVFPKVPVIVRNRLISEYKKRGLNVLLKELKRKDEEYFCIVDHNNHQRIIRALEVIRFSGKKFSNYMGKSNIKREFKIIKIGIDIDKNKLNELIDKRVNYMINKGLFLEVKALINYRNKNALQTVGYKEIFKYYDNKISKIEAINKIKINTKKYAKRQLTWFKKDKKIKWLNPNVNEIIDYINKTISNY